MKDTKSNTNHYDIIVIAFAKPSQDARLLNIIRTLSEEKSICLFALDDKGFLSFSEKHSIKYIPIHLCNSQFLFRKLLRFTFSVKEFSKKVSGSKILASDFYSLSAAASFKKEHNSFFYDSREIYSALGSLSKSPIKQKILTLIEKSYVKYVDKIIVSGELDADYLKSNLYPDKDYSVIMNLPPYQEVVKSNYIREKYKISDLKKIIIYQGVFLNGRGLKSLINVVEKLNDYVLFAIGDGPLKIDLLNEVSKRNLYDKVIIANAVDYSELHNITCSADIGAALFEPISLSYTLALPNKLFEYILANIPVIATNLPAIKNINNEFQFGELVDNPYDIEEIKQKLLFINSNTDFYCSNITNASKKYNYNTQIAKVKELFN